jgi:hypothetical protein
MGVRTQSLLTARRGSAHGRVSMLASSKTQPPLDALQAVLSAATEMVNGLLADPTVQRLLDAFLAFPEADREAILRVLEKDSAWRRVVERTADATGIDVVPNPHASLYVHVLDGANAPERDGDVIRGGIQTFVNMMPLLFQDAVHAQWTDAARDLARVSDPALRELVARLARETLAIVAEANAANEERE